MTLSVRFTVRMTENEKVVLEEKAKKLNVKSSKFVRYAVFKFQPLSSLAPMTSVDWDTYHLLGQMKFELNKIGTNINQLTHDANLSVMMGSPMQSQLDEFQKLSGCLNQLVSLMSDVRSQITTTAGLTPQAEQEKRMIGKIIKGRGFRGCLSYVLEKTGAEIIDTNMDGDSPRSLATEFSLSRQD